MTACWRRAVALRSDIPDHMFRDLLSRATEVVQRRLLAKARPETQAEIRRVPAKVSGEVDRAEASPRDFSAAQAKDQDDGRAAAN